MITGTFRQQSGNNTTHTEVKFHTFNELMEFLNKHELDRPIRSGGNLGFKNYLYGDMSPVALVDIKGMTEPQIKMLVD